MRQLRLFAPLLFLLSLLLILPACTVAEQLPQTVAEAAVAPSAPAVATSTLPAPVIVVAEAAVMAAAEQPSLGAAPADMAPGTLTPRPTATANLPAQTATTAAPASPTPGPTFTPPPPPDSGSLDHYWLVRPVAEGGVVWTNKTYPFGSTRGGTLRPHHGVEFDVGYGTEILAAAPGTVVVAGSDADEVYGPQPNFYGNLVVVEIDGLINGQNIYTLYAHLQDVLVSVGQRVNARDVVGLSGATGVADGPHMHLEVRVGENSYAASRNPLLWLYPFAGRGTVAGRVIWPDGASVMDAPVTLRRIDGPSRYIATTSYASAEIQSDPTWGENFVLDDVEAGYYEISVQSATRAYKAELWVYAGRTSFMEIVLEGEPR